MTRPRTHTSIPAATLGFLLMVALAAPAAAADGPAGTTDGDTTTIELVERQNEGGQYIPKGGEPQDFPDDQDFVPNLGDAFTFTSELRQDGREVGSNSGTCTILDLETNLHRCVVEFTFANGTFVADGRIAFPDEDELPEPFTVAIVSGTGDFAGARGTLTVAEHEESTDLTAVLTSGGQVSQVPSGGAAAGGGSGDATDSALLLGLGGLVALGGLGLLARGRRRAAGVRS